MSRILAQSMGQADASLVTQWRRGIEHSIPSADAKKLGSVLIVPSLQKSGEGGESCGQALVEVELHGPDVDGIHGANLFAPRCVLIDVSGSRLALSAR